MSKAEAALDLWLKEVAPSPELRKWFGHDPHKWEKFCQRYWDELAGQGEAISRLQEKGREGNLTLVYSSWDESHNAAVALKLYLEGKPSEYRWGTTGLKSPFEKVGIKGDFKGSDEIRPDLIKGGY